MTLSLVQMKLHLPHTTAPREHLRLVPRPRLWAKLNGVCCGQLVLISAPAGFGKTTLIAEWIATARDKSHPCPVAWLTLDEADNDPVRFFAYLTAALQTALPSLGHTLSAALHSPGLLPPEAIMTQLINEIGQQRADLILVLDDYHTIESVAIHNSMRYLLDHLPPQLCLIILTRSDPPMPLARLRARGATVEIRAADLSFNQEETQRFLNDVMRLQLSTSDVITLMQRTEGWVVGLQLAALYLSSGIPSERFIAGFSGSHTYIIDYLVEEVLTRQPTEIKEFLLRTSILDRFCAPLTDAVCARRDSQRVLEQLERANLFLVPLDQERKWYRYHHLFADMLRRLLEQTESQLLLVLHEWAAIWFEQQGFLDEAIRHAFASTHLDHAALLLEAQAERWIAHGEFITLSEWLEKLPAEVMAQHPRLMLAQAECFGYHHQHERSEATLARVEEIVKALPADPSHVRLLGKAAVLRSDIALNHGDLDGTIALTGEALALLPADEWRLRARAWLLQGIGYLWRNQYEEACYAYAQSAHFGTLAGDLLDTIYANSSLAQTLHVQGRLQASFAALQRALAFAAEHHADQSVILASSIAVYAELLYEWNRLEEASEKLADAIRRAQLARNPRTLLRAYTSLLPVLRAQNRMDEVQATVRQAELLVQSYTLPPAMLDNFAVEQMRLWLQEQKFEQVAEWLQQRGICEGNSIPARQERIYGLLAELSYARGDYAAALRVVDQILATIEAYGPTLNQIIFQSLKSLILSACGDVDASQTFLRRVLERAEPEGLIRLLVDWGEPMRRLLITHRSALTSGPQATISDRYLTQLLAAFPAPVASVIAAPSMPEAASPIHIPTDSLVEPLTDREQEVLFWVNKGLSDSQIAERLIVAVGTVKRHLNNIYGKLGVRSRTQALARARELNLLREE